MKNLISETYLFFSLLEGGHMGPEERYITLLLHNKVGREIRVTPSRGRKGGYVVAKNGYLKVSMIFPKSGVLSEPVTFEAKDLETLSALEIDGDVKTVSIAPGEFPDEVINMTITAPGKSNFVCLFVCLLVWLACDLMTTVLEPEMYCLNVLVFCDFISRINDIFSDRSDHV